MSPAWLMHDGCRCHSCRRKIETCELLILNASTTSPTYGAVYCEVFEGIHVLVGWKTLMVTSCNWRTGKRTLARLNISNLGRSWTTVRLVRDRHRCLGLDPQHNNETAFALTLEASLRWAMRIMLRHCEAISNRCWAPQQRNEKETDT